MSKTREDYIEELQWMDEVTEYSLRKSDFAVVNGREDLWQLEDIFGSWKSAREADGLPDPRCRPRNPEGFNQQKEEIKSWIKRQKDHVGCQAPGCDNESGYRLAFHHVDPSQKEGEVSQLVMRSEFEMAKNEIKKCVILCNQCHATVHSRFGNVDRPEWADDYLVENAT